MPYDALKAPDPQDWLDLDEQERIDEVIEYHRRHHPPMGESVKLHGVAHVVVENQIAFGQFAGSAGDDRPFDGRGLRPARGDSRSGQRGHGHRLRRCSHKKGEDVGDINVKYADELAALTAESWRAQR